ncbi:MAG: HlyD family efflux transporter periplasmic adaptor subunit [Planctomycetota bacterium]|nr:MAG: HlyD family efflux transporter periplasmic adaptor subunit [Planctomycetota bacterium]
MTVTTAGLASGTSASRSDGGERRAEPDRFRTLQSRFQEVVTAAENRSELITLLARVLTETIRADILVLARVEENHPIQLDGLLHPLAGLPEPMMQSFRDSALASCREGRTRIGRIGRPPNQLLIAVPLAGTAARELLLALFLTPSASPDVLTTIVEFAASTVGSYDTQQRSLALDHEMAAAAALIDLSARIQAASNLVSATQILCEEASQYLQTGPMAIGIVSADRPGSRLTAISHHELPVPPERLNLAFESALDESLLRAEPGVWPPLSGAMRHSLVTHKQLALLTGQEAVISVPLRTHAGEMIGSWVVLCPKAATVPQVTGFLQAAAPLMAAVLQTLARAEKGKLGRALESVGRSLTQRKGRWMIALLLATAAVFCIPLPGSCQIQPVSLRYVVAPFEARLLKSAVEPGDEIRAGQVVATLDGEEIRFELAGALAEVDRASKERDSYLADKEINASQVAQLEMARMAAKADLLQQRNSQLELRSPVDGVVISGDMRKAEGAPLTMGQTLFEIAPLNEMVLEIGVPEDDIAHVQLGQSVEAVLGALPDRVWTGTVERIHPRSELIDDDYVFVVEIQFSNDHGLLRPGMKGRAKIETAKHSLGWNLLHKAIDEVRFRLGW